MRTMNGKRILLMMLVNGQVYQYFSALTEPNFLTAVSAVNLFSITFHWGSQQFIMKNFDSPKEVYISYIIKF